MKIEILANGIVKEMAFGIPCYMNSKCKWRTYGGNIASS